MPIGTQHSKASHVMSNSTSTATNTSTTTTTTTTPGTSTSTITTAITNTSTTLPLLLLLQLLPVRLILLLICIDYYLNNIVKRRNVIYFMTCSPPLWVGETNLTELTAGSAGRNVRITNSAHFMVYAPVICRVRILKGSLHPQMFPTESGRL